MHDAGQEQVEAILAEAVDQLLAGRTPDIEALALAHPALADEIRRRWQELRKLHDPIGPLLQTDAGSGIFAPGAWVGNFRLIREIGRGGMGVVYEAEQREPRRSVAVKIIRGGTYLDEHAVKMFQREAAALARLKHPAIAAVYEAGRTEDGRHFFAMELVQGVGLLEYVRGVRRPAQPGSVGPPVADVEALAAGGSLCGTGVSPVDPRAGGRHRKGPPSAAGVRPADQSQELSLRQRLELFDKVCEGVNYAHQRGVIHRDLKPGNILIDEHGLPRILDFGLARITDADVNVTTQATDTGRIQGTLPYMSPEQARGDSAEIDVRSDVYALGVILYELLTGRLPHDLTRASVPEAVRTICEDPPLRPSSGTRWDGRPARQFRGDLETVVLKALEKDPSRRYQSVAALADDVSRFLVDQPILARPPSAAYQLRKFVTRHKVGAAFAASLLCSLAALAIVMSVMSVKLAHERDQAEQARAAALVAERQAKEDRDAQIRERERAEKAEQEAKTEAETAREVTDFLVGIFAVADPSVAQGEKITAREILDTGADRVLKEMSGRPAIQARFLDAIGRVYVNLGLYDRAEPLLEKALAMRQHASGEEHVDVARSLFSLAMLRHRQGNLSEAEALYQRSLSIMERVLGAGDREVQPILGDLVLVYAAEGKLDSAESLVTHWLQLKESESGSTDPWVVFLRNTLEIIRQASANPNVTNRLPRQPLAIRPNSILDTDEPDNVHIGPEESGKAINMAARASSELAQGNYAEAESYLREALTIFEKAFDPDDLELAPPLEMLGLVQWYQGKLMEAESAYRRALVIKAKALGVDHPDMTGTLNNLAEFYLAQDKCEQAEPLLAQAFLIRQKTPDGRPDLGTILNNLALLYEIQGTYDKAEVARGLFLRVFEETLGKDDPLVAQTCTDLAGLACLAGEYQKAEELCKRAMRIYRKKQLDRDQPEIAAVQTLQGWIHLEKNEPAEAEPLLRESLATRRKKLPPDDWRTANTESLLGACLVELGRYDEAEPLLVDSYPRIKADFGIRRRRGIEALERIVRLYEAWDKPEKAVEYRRMLEEARATSPVTTSSAPAVDK